MSSAISIVSDDGLYTDMKSIKKWLKKNIKYILAADAALILAAGAVVVATEKPADVTGLEVVGGSFSSVDLEWNKSENAKAYRVYRSKDGVDYEYIGSTTDNLYRDTDLRTGDTYYYGVTARNGLKSTKLDTASAPAATPSLEEPSLEVDTSDGEMRLNFSEVEGAIGYEIIRNGEVIDQSTENTYVDENAGGDEAYDYEVRAYRYKKEPVYSESSNTINAELHAVKNFTVDRFDNNLLLNWDNSEHYSKYKVYNGEEEIAEVTDSEYTIEGYELSKLYDIKVVGYSADEEQQSPESGRRFEVVQEPMDNKGAIEAAVQWGIKIAADNSFTYGAGKRAHRYGCYFCQTNVGPRKNIKGKSKVNGHSYAKTYCCNPFVHACYAHGAGDPAMLKACRSGHGIAMTQKSFTRYGCWKNVGKLSRANLKRGDVLVRSDHVMMYIGDGKIVHASGGGWDAGSIQVTGLNKRRYTFVMRYTGEGSGTMDIIRDVDDSGNLLDEKGKVIEQPEAGPAEEAAENTEENTQA